MFEESLNSCVIKSYFKNIEEIIEALKQDNKKIHSDFRYWLAKGIVSELGKINGLRAAYIHGSSLKDTAGMFSDIDLFLDVEDKQKCQKKLSEIEKEAVSAYSSLIEKEFPNSALPFLDFQFVNQQYISSLIHEPPIKIWEVKVK